MKTMGIIALGVCIHICQVAYGETWYVAPPPSGHDSNPGTELEPFATIQKGIDIAAEGDTVIVAEGTYVENIEFKGNNITLRSADPFEPKIVAKTIIDGNQAGSVVTFAGTENETCVLSGFTIRNGNAGTGGGICGGTENNHSQAAVRNNVITANLAYAGGGLAFCDGTIRTNTITGNRADPGEYMFEPTWGGGLYDCDGIIRENTVCANWARYAGGLEDCDGAIQNNAIARNQAQGIYDYDAKIVVGGDGGGLCRCDGRIDNNTVVGNRAAGAWDPRYDQVRGGYAGGLEWCRAIIRNCIIWGNTASVSGPQLYYSSDATYSCVEGWTGGGEGNTSDPPGFVDLARSDYHLSQNSPCIDKGKNEEWMWDAIDVDGNPRIWRGKDSWTVDMGAYEYGALPFQIVAVVKPDAGNTQLTWNSRPGNTYSVCSRTNLLTGEWIEEDKVESGGESTTWTDSDGSSPCKFYRIELNR